MRWFEYAISSSIMITLIATFFGIYDGISLFCIFVLNAVMNLCGYIMELNHARSKVSSDDNEEEEIPLQPLSISSNRRSRPPVVRSYQMDPMPLDWSPFYVGTLAGIAPWIAIFMSLLSSPAQDRIPTIVYGALLSYLILFALFPINMVLQYKQIGWWKPSYVRGEIVYCILSLVAKTLLGWLLAGALLQPSVRI